MQTLSIEATKYTPQIEFDPTQGVFNIKGKSYPENTFEFYEPLLQWIKNYFFGDDFKKNATFNFEITYNNSSSSKVFYDLFDILEEAIDGGHQVNVNWYYDEDNEVALESGADFKDDFEKLNINLQVIK